VVVWACGRAGIRTCGRVRTNLMIAEFTMCNVVVSVHTHEQPKTRCLSSRCMRGGAHAQVVAQTPTHKWWRKRPRGACAWLSRWRRRVHGLPEVSFIAAMRSGCFSGNLSERNEPLYLRKSGLRTTTRRE
jgi:hypothetical protein